MEDQLPRPLLGLTILLGRLRLAAFVAHFGWRGRGRMSYKRVDIHFEVLKLGGGRSEG